MACDETMMRFSRLEKYLQSAVMKSSMWFLMKHSKTFELYFWKISSGIRGSSLLSSSYFSHMAALVSMKPTLGKMYCST